MKYLGAAATDVGIRKKTNQDSVCIKIADTPHYGQIAMAVICDGMGGLEKGELASADVIMMLSRWFEQQLPVLLKNYSWQDLSRKWDDMIKSENYRILEYGKQYHINLGTTLTAMLIIENRYMIAHVGDSRVYRITEGGVEQLTEDQTFVAREIKRGNLTAEEAKVHPKRNMLLQCVGASRTVSPDFLFGEIQPGEVYMLCSDGFRHVLEPEEIHEKFAPGHLTDTENMTSESRYLIDLVKERKERDNISVALIKCTEAVG